MFVCTVVGENTPVLDLFEGLKLPVQVEKVDSSASQIYFDENIADVAGLKTELDRVADAYKIDVALQPKQFQQKKLVVFDMDSTLIQNECIDLIAKRANVEPQVAAITERAMRGEMDFQQSLKERVGLLKGIKTTIYEELTQEITLSEGTKELCAGLKKNGVKMAVLSGGFQPVVDWIKGLLDLDYAYANHLATSEDGTELAGYTEGAVVDGDRKAQLLREIAEKEGIPLELVCAVGDGSNDLPMMATAGFGIAWHAKPLVQEKAPSRINGDSLANALYYLGYKR